MIGRSLARVLTLIEYLSDSLAAAVARRGSATEKWQTVREEARRPAR